MKKTILLLFFVILLSSFGNALIGNLTYYIDDFNRADNDDINNNWTYKCNYNCDNAEADIENNLLKLWYVSPNVYGWGYSKEFNITSYNNFYTFFMEIYPIEYQSGNAGLYIYFEDINDTLCYMFQYYDGKYNAITSSPYYLGGIASLINGSLIIDYNKTAQSVFFNFTSYVGSGSVSYLDSVISNCGDISNITLYFFRDYGNEYLYIDNMYINYTYYYELPPIIPNETYVNETGISKELGKINETLNIFWYWILFLFALLLPFIINKKEKHNALMISIFIFIILIFFQAFNYFNLLEKYRDMLTIINFLFIIVFALQLNETN